MTTPPPVSEERLHDVIVLSELNGTAHYLSKTEQRELCAELTTARASIEGLRKLCDGYYGAMMRKHEHLERIEKERDAAEHQAATLEQSLTESVEERAKLLDQLQASQCAQKMLEDDVRALRANDAQVRLVRFAAWAIDEHRQNECADIDALAIQEKLTTLGILVEREMTAPCGESCPCMDVVSGESEWTCYIMTDEARAAIDAAQEPAHE